MNGLIQPVQFAYVDASGDPNLDLSKKGTGPYFVVAAVLVDSQNHETLLAQAEAIRIRFFANGEMKSSAVGKDVQRRRSILEALQATDLKFTALVVDKGEINRTSGLQYKRSFLKHLQGKLIRRLYQCFIELRVFADQHGSEDFMKGFERYLEASVGRHK